MKKKDLRHRYMRANTVPKAKLSGTHMSRSTIDRMCFRRELETNLQEEYDQQISHLHTKVEQKQQELERVHGEKRYCLPWYPRLYHGSLVCSVTV